MKHKIGIDLDGVCRDFLDGMNKAFVHAYPHLASKVKPQTSYAFDNWPFKEAGVDPWDFMRQYPETVFAFSKPIPGSIEAVREVVNELESKGNEIIIVSHQTPDISRYSWLWLYLNQVPVSNVIFVSDSTEKWKYVDIMIDDSPHVLDAKPVGKISFKVNHPYNKDNKSDWSIDHIKEFLPIFIKNY